MDSNFVIARRGSREKVKAALATEVAKPAEASQAHIKAAVSYLTTMIDALPEKYNAVSLAANGDASEGRFVLHSAVVNGETIDI